MQALSSEDLQLLDEAARCAGSTSQLAWHHLPCQPRALWSHHTIFSIKFFSNLGHYCCIAMSRFCYEFVSRAQRQAVVATLHDDNQEPSPRPRSALCSCKSSKPPSGDGFYSRSVVDEGVIT